MLTDMTIQRMDNVAIVVRDLDAAVAFFTELGMEVEGKGRSKASGRTAPSDSTASGARSR
jgi:catechol 2,3-dioxygenase-like lactoylglutathione lyase family enzyme